MTPAEEMVGHVRWAVRLTMGVAKAAGMSHRAEDLTGPALEAMTLAWRRYDRERGPFEAFAAKRIRGAVVRAIGSERRRASTEIGFDFDGAEAGGAGGVEDRASGGHARQIAARIMEAITVDCLARDARAGEATFLEPEAFERLHVELDGLSAEERRLLDLLYWHDATWEQVGQALGITSRAAEYRHAKLREKLKFAWLRWKRS